MDWRDLTEVERARERSRRYQERMKRYRRKNAALLNLSELPQGTGSEEGSSPSRKDLQEDGKVRSVHPAQKRR